MELNCTLLTGESCERGGLIGQELFPFVVINYREYFEVVVMLFKDHGMFFKILYVLKIWRYFPNSGFQISHYLEDTHGYVSVE